MPKKLFPNEVVTLLKSQSFLEYILAGKGFNSDLQSGPITIVCKGQFTYKGKMVAAPSLQSDTKI